MFIKKLQQELECAINAVYGDDVEKIDEKLNKFDDLRDVMTESELIAIFRKMKFYIFD